MEAYILLWSATTFMPEKLDCYLVLTILHGMRGRVAASVNAYVFKRCQLLDYFCGPGCALSKD